MARELSRWCQDVQCALIRRNMSTADLAESIGMTKAYVSAIVNGRKRSEPAVRAISKFLNVPERKNTLDPEENAETDVLAVD